MLGLKRYLKFAADDSVKFYPALTNQISLDISCESSDSHEMSILIKPPKS